MYSQSWKPKKVDRDSYDGPVAQINNGVGESPIKASNNPIVDTSQDDWHNRPKTSSGARNLHDSSFAFSGKFYTRINTAMVSNSFMLHAQFRIYHEHLNIV